MRRVFMLTPLRCYERSSHYEKRPMTWWSSAVGDSAPWVTLDVSRRARSEARPLSTGLIRHWTTSFANGVLRSRSGAARPGRPVVVPRAVARGSSPGAPHPIDACVAIAGSDGFSPVVVGRCPASPGFSRVGVGAFQRCRKYRRYQPKTQQKSAPDRSGSVLGPKARREPKTPAERTIPLREANPNGSTPIGRHWTGTGPPLAPSPARRETNAVGRIDPPSDSPASWIAGSWIVCSLAG